MQLINTAKIISFASTGLLGGLGLAYFFIAVFVNHSGVGLVLIILSLAIPVGLPLLTIRPALNLPTRPQPGGLFLLVVGIILIALSGYIGIGLIQILAGAGYIVAGILAMVSATPANGRLPVNNAGGYPNSNGYYSANPATVAYSNQPYQGEDNKTAQTASVATQNPFFTSAFDRAVHMAQQGRKQEAHFELGKLYRERPREVNLLLWLAFTAPDIQQTRNFVEQAYNADPQSASVAEALRWLATQSY